MCFSEFGRRRVVRLVQPSKAPSPISSRLSGRMTLVNPIQPQKACLSICFIPYRKSIILRFVQLLKAMSAIDLTLVPMVSFWIHVVPENTLAAISTFPLFSSLVALGNTTLVHLLRLSLNGGTWSHGCSLARQVLQVYYHCSMPESYTQE